MRTHDHVDRLSISALIALLLIGLLCRTSLPQAPQREKPKLKDFGSSLKKLKWDPQKNQAVTNTQPSADGTSDDDVVRIETSLVVSDVLVTDRNGRAVRDLKATDFAVSEDDVAQQVGLFTLGDDAKLSRSIVLVIDYSRSQFPYIADSIEAAKILVDKLGPHDQMAIVTDDIELLAEFTSDKRDLKRALDSLIERNKGSKGVMGIGKRQPRFGRSSQFSALMATLNEAFDAEDQTPVIVFQTDGDELEYLRNSPIVHEVPPHLPPELESQVQEEVEYKKKLQRSLVTEFSLEDVFRAVEKSRVTIYTIIPRTRLLGFTEDEQIQRLTAEDERVVATWAAAASSAKLKSILQARQEERQKKLTKEIWQARLDQELKVQNALVDLSKLSGGWAEFLETKSQAAETYNRIVKDLNQRYIIGYYPTNKAHDGKRRRISISVKNHPDYVITSRTSYYAPGQ
ncbi:MAG TPA: VWA domain-containing protein [Pyrinomonadaceae bacterium]|jgi:VWFA-related protein|nr:VWA domain-containing protein [Pyrinomonadaceae bacterium]